MGAGQGVGEGDLVVVGDEGLDIDVKIREGVPHLTEERLVALRSGLLAR